VAALTARVHAAGAGGRTGALAIFDAGYVLEAMSELAMHGHYMGSDAGTRGARVAGLAQPDEGRALILKSGVAADRRRGHRVRADAHLEDGGAAAAPVEGARRRRSRTACSPPTWPACRCQ
jgi:hypothetical protein